MNAFWNPFYYYPLRRTITKPLFFSSEKRLVDEIRSLSYLASTSNRSLILPNLLGIEQLATVQKYQGRQAMWPGFRLLHVKKGKAVDVDVLEPAFYWRVSRDYAGRVGDEVVQGSGVPLPVLLPVPSTCSLPCVENLLNTAPYSTSPRIVLNMLVDGESDSERSVREQRLVSWADHSVGHFEDNFDVSSRLDRNLPSLSYKSLIADGISDPALGKQIVDGVRACQKIFHKIYGNRSCFDKCD